MQVKKCARHLRSLPPSLSQDLRAGRGFYKRERGSQIKKLGGWKRSLHAGHSHQDLETGQMMVWLHHPGLSVLVLHHPGFMSEGEQISQNWDDWDDWDD